MAYDVGSDALSGAELGAGVGSAIAPGPGTIIGAGVGALGGALDGLFTSAPEQYTDPNAAARQVLANNLMSAKTGEDYAAHAQAQNEASGREMFADVSRSWGGNPAVASSLYNKIGRETESANTTAGIAGARINEDNQKEAGTLLSNDSALNFKEWQANQDIKNAPNALESMATQGIGTLAGKGLSRLTNPDKTNPDKTNPAQTAGEANAAIGGGDQSIGDGSNAMGDDIGGSGSDT